MSNLLAVALGVCLYHTAAEVSQARNNTVRCGESSAGRCVYTRGKLASPVCQLQPQRSCCRTGRPAGALWCP